MKKIISILVPAYNEEEVIELFYKETNKTLKKIDATKYTFEFLFINDGSSDKTLSILEKLRENDSRICFIDLSRNFGKEIALYAGFDNLNINTDAVIIMDADLQDPPYLIEKMIREWEKGYDDVYAKRISRKGETFLKKATSSIFYKLLSASSKIPIQKDTGDFRLLDKKCINAIQSLKESQRYTKGLFSWIGFRKKEIEFDREERKAGETKWNYFNLINLAIEGLISFTTSPLRISTFIGLLVSLFSFTLLIKVFIEATFYDIDVKGYPSMMITITFLGGVQLLSIGLIGEYLGRIFKETKNRPLYFYNKKELNEK